VVSTDATPTAYRAADSRVVARSRPSMRSRPFAWAVRQSLQRARLVVALSEWTADQLVTHDGVGRARVRVVPPGIDTAGTFFPRERASERVRITFVGYDFVRKGGDLILHWARHTSTRNWELHVVSPDAPREVPMGVITHADTRGNRVIAQLLGGSDIFVLPTSQDIVPVAVVEALASGCAVVSSSIGAIPELLDQGNAGMLVPPGSVPDFCRALDTLVTDAGLRRGLQEAGRANAVERYDISGTSMRLRAAIVDAASG
jgi:glycosyltransferase involved in cell wall biosynthesis